MFRVGDDDDDQTEDKMRLVVCSVRMKLLLLSNSKAAGMNFMEQYTVSERVGVLVVVRRCIYEEPLQLTFSFYSFLAPAAMLQSNFVGSSKQIADESCANISLTLYLVSTKSPHICASFSLRPTDTALHSFLSLDHSCANINITTRSNSTTSLVFV